MNNILNIAKKEFQDLSSDRILLFIISIYIIYVLIDLYNINNLYTTGYFENSYGIYGFDPVANLAGSMMDQYILMLSRYGALLGIAVGFLSISSERHSGALNVLSSKPLYRDTIITGKMIGTLIFLLCVFTLVSALLTSGILCICGSTLAPIIGEYLARIPIALLTSLLYVLVFFLVSMCISILITNYAFPLILSVLAWKSSELMIVSSTTGIIAVFLGDWEGITAIFWNISPDGIIQNISFNVMENFSIDIWGCIGLLWFDLAKLSLYVIILLFISYTAFLRKDIA